MKALKILKNIILIIGVAVILVLCGLMIHYRTFFTMDLDTHRRTTVNSPLLWLWVAGVIGGLILIRPLMGRIQSKWVFLFWTIVYVAAGCYLILNVPQSIDSDQFMTMKHAKLMNAGDYQGLLPGHYINEYPFNLCLLTFERLLLHISKDLRLFYFVYLALCLGENWFLYRTAAIVWKGNRTAVNYTVTMLFLFVPKFFFILFIYNEGPGGFCASAGVYCAARIIGRIGKIGEKPATDAAKESLPENTAVRNAGKRRAADAADAIAGGLLLALACRFRMNYLIVVIALAVILILWWITHRKSVSVLVLLAVTGIGFTIFSKGLTAYYESVSGMKISGVPMNATIAMGLQGKPDDEWPGWFNAYELNVYLDNDCNSEKAAAAASENIHERLLQFREDPGMALGFFTNKAVSTWTDPLFQSVWIGPRNDDGRGQDCKTEILNSLYQGDWVYIILDWFMNAYNIILLFASAIWLLAGHRLTGREFCWTDLFPMVYLIGGFLFHQFWETKSQYVFGYVFIMAFSAAGLFAAIPLSGKNKAGRALK